jgi:hypothetical protein
MFRRDFDFFLLGNAIVFPYSPLSFNFEKAGGPSVFLHWQGPSFKFAPHAGHRPRQLSLQIDLMGSVR